MTEHRIQLRRINGYTTLAWRVHCWCGWWSNTSHDSVAMAQQDWEQHYQDAT